MSLQFQSAWQRPPVIERSSPQSDRRADQRIRQEVHAEMAPWLGDHAGPSFGVLVRDLSTTGAGIIHSGRLKLGAKYLLDIPRPGQEALSVFVTVVRCNEIAGGLFNLRLEADSVLEIAVRASMLRAERTENPKRRGRHAFVALVTTLFVTAAALTYLRLML